MTEMNPGRKHFFGQRWSVTICFNRGCLWWLWEDGVVGVALSAGGQAPRERQQGCEVAGIQTWMSTAS